MSLLVSRIGKVRSVTAGPARAVVLAAALTFSPFVQAEPIRGAGSTFAAPIIAKWATAYKNARADGGDFVTLDWTVDYEPVGSLAGLMRLNSRNWISRQRMFPSRPPNSPRTAGSNFRS